MQIHMTGAAQDQCFAAASSYDLDPARLFSTLVSVQILEGTKVMDLHGICHVGCPTVFTDLGEEPLFQF